MKFLYVIACCIMLSSPNLFHASEIETKNSVSDFDWLMGDKDGNFQEIEKPIPIITKEVENNLILDNANNTPIHSDQDHEDYNPDAQIIADVDAIVNSIYKGLVSFARFLTDDENI